MQCPFLCEDGLMAINIYKPERKALAYYVLNFLHVYSIQPAKLKNLCSVYICMYMYVYTNKITFLNITQYDLFNFTSQLYFITYAI